MAFRKAFFLTLLTLAVAQNQAPIDGNEQIPQLNTFVSLEQRPLTPTITTIPANNYYQNVSMANRNTGPAVSITLPVPNKARQRDIIERIAEGSQEFAIEMFVRLVDAISPMRQDLVLSPFAVWSLLLPLSEGASNNTLAEMRSAMRLKDDQKLLREAFRIVKSYLSLDTPTISVASMQALFTDLNQPINREYESIIEREYGADIQAIDFFDPVKGAAFVNAAVSKATRNVLNNVILPQDLMDAKLVLLSALFFKGQWKKPFNASLTRREPFYDEENNNIGNVEMMTQMGNFNFTRMNELEAHVLELPYGNENRLSMLIILPNKGVSLSRVAHNLQSIRIPTIFEKLAADFDVYGFEDIEIFMPKFETEKHYTLNVILNEMGINDLFNPHTADLSKMGTNLFVSTLLQSSRIIVDEEGTTAGAYTASVLVNKASPTKFYLNRPFMYLIIEKRSNALLFCGHIMNPTKFQYPPKAF